MARQRSDVAELTFVMTPEMIGDELPPIINPRASGFLRFQKLLQDNQGTWFKIMKDTASGNDAAVLKKEFPEYEFATRLRADAAPGTIAGTQNIRNKDLFARYMGLEWYLEQIKEKQAKRRANAKESGQVTRIPTPGEVPHVTRKEA